jgi:hypothetical protein
MLMVALLLSVSIPLMFWITHFPFVYGFEIFLLELSVLEFVFVLRIS